MITTTNAVGSLRELRAAAGVSQSGLAAAVGVSQPTVAYWEQGSAYPTLDKLPRLAAALGISEYDLYCTLRDAREVRDG